MATTEPGCNTPLGEYAATLKTLKKQLNDAPDRFAVRKEANAIAHLAEAVISLAMQSETARRDTRLLDRAREELGAIYDYPHKTDAVKAWAEKAIECIERELSAAPLAPQSAELPREPTPEMIAAVSTILQPYAAKLVWKRMLESAPRSATALIVDAETLGRIAAWADMKPQPWDTGCEETLQKWAKLLLPIVRTADRSSAK